MIKPMHTVVWIVIVLASTVFTGCGKPGNPASVPDQTTPEAESNPSPVEVHIVESGTIAEYVEATGNIYADAHVVVYPKTSGQIVRIDAAEGDRVTAGRQLALIDDESAQLRVRQLEVTRRQAREKLDRTAQLYENRMISREAFEDAGYNYDNADVACKIANLDLEYTRIKSPIDGIVVARAIGVGDLVTTASPAFEIIDPDSLQIDVFLPEREAGRIQPGMKTLIFPDSLPDTSFDARVHRINPSVDPKTGTVKVTLAFETKSPELASGMFVRVRILVALSDNTVLLPKRALIRRRNENRVFVVDAGDRAELRLLTLGLENLHTYEVLSGLEPGERLVVVGQHTLENGQAVKVMDQSTLTPNPESESEASE